MRYLIALLSVLALALTGCGDDEPDRSPIANPVQTTAATSVAPSPPAPVPLTKEQAAARYIELTKPYNSAADHYNEVRETYNATPSEQGFTNLKVAAGNLAVAARTFSIRLQNTAWPADITEPVNDAVEYLATEVGIMNQMAAADNIDDYAALADTLPEPESSSELIRQRLGLPSAPVD